MVRNLPASSLNTFFEEFKKILGYHPSIADKFLLRKYTESYG